MKFFYQKYIHQIYAFLLLPLINISSLLLIQDLKENITGIGNTLGYRWYMLLWSMSAAFYFYTYTKPIFQNHKILTKKIHLVLFLSCVFMVISTMLPYEPIQFPLLSKWHIRIAVISTLTYIALLVYFMYILLKKDYLNYQLFYPPFISIIGLCSIYFILFGSVNIILEICFTCCMGWYLYFFQNK